jgi:uncharacterized membrane protein
VNSGPARVRTERGLDRLVTFLDAVVAIAITLLVLPLVEVLGDDAPEDLGALLSDHLARFGSFALSFVVIARLWMAHHRLIEWVGGYDSVFVWVNMAWAFTIVLLPFSSQVIAEFGTDRLSVGLYIGTVAASAVAAAVLVLLVRSRPALRREGVGAGDVDVVPALVAAVLLLLALVVGVLVRPVNFYALLLLLLSTPAERLVRHAHLPA